MSYDIKILYERYPKLEDIANDISQALAMIRDCIRCEGTIFICGNGGSAADSEHIVGELMKSFLRKRPVQQSFREKLENLFGEEGSWCAARLQSGIKAVSLVGPPSLTTAFSNDVSPEMVFAQQLFVLAQPEDLLLGISTSGNSVNVVKAMQIAKAMDITRIAMTGSHGGSCGELADCCIQVPAEDTYRIQEYHMPIYHALCAALEEEFYG